MNSPCSSMDAGRPQVRAASIISRSSPMQASSPSDRLDSTGSWSMVDWREGVLGGAGVCVGGGVVVAVCAVVAVGSTVFGINAGVAAMVPGAGVSVGSGVGAGSEQAAMAARMTRSRAAIGSRDFVIGEVSVLR